MAKIQTININKDVILMNNKPNGKLLYQTVKDYIVDKINKNEYKASEAIPAERELCKILDVSRYTVRKAIKELVKEGYLYRVQGNGTFVFDREHHHLQSNNFIGVILPQCKYEMEINILKGVQDILRENNYGLVFMDSENDYKIEAETIQTLKSEGAAGLIIEAAENQKDSTAISDLKSENFPFVLVDRQLRDCETDCVLSDNIEAGYQAAEYLIRLGHEKIAFIKHTSVHTSTIVDRIRGYRNALLDYGIDFESVYTLDAGELFIEEDNLMKFNPEIINSLTEYLKGNGITAVITINDFTALDVFKICREADIKVPDQLSVISFDDLDIIKRLEVPLSTVAQPSRKIGRKAAEILVEKIKESGNEDRDYYTQIFYRTKLIERSSCKDLK